MVKPNPIPPHNFSESLQLFHKIYIIHAYMHAISNMQIGILKTTLRSILW